MGQKYAAYGATGTIVAYYDSVDSPVPEGVAAIEITDAEWQTCLSTPGYSVANGALVVPAAPTGAELLAQAISAQIAALSSACQAAVLSGFASNALGSTCSYPSTLQDQINQNTVAGAASGGVLWCEANGGWSMKAHTQPQAQAVVASFAAWLNKCQQQLLTLTAQVNAEATIESVQAIYWTDPITE